MKKYYIEMEVVTPLSVGAGNDNEWMPGADFVQKDGKVYVLDLQKAMDQGIDIEALSYLFIKSDGKGISKLLGNKLEHCAKYVFKSPASTSNSIKAFLRTQLYDLPLVAGSSLKGAIRSALFKHLRSNTETDNVSVFGTMNNGTDYMRFIHISDFEMPTTILVNTKLFNLRRENGVWQGGWKHKRDETTSNFRSDGFNTLYECVEPRKKGYGSIVFEDDAFNLLLRHVGYNTYVSHTEQKSILMQNGIQELFRIINATTREYLRKERDFFDKYKADRSEEILDNIDQLTSMIPDDDSACLIKMSAGVGFHSIIGDWKYDDYSKTGTWESGKNAGKQKYKSRKTAEYNGLLQLMGFVKLRALDKIEAERISLEQQSSRQTILNNILTPIKMRETARLQAIEETQRKREAIVAEEQRRLQYQQLIQEAESLYREGMFDEAIAKANAAAAFGPGDGSHQDILTRCNKAKELEEFKKGQEDKDKKLFKEPLSAVLVGKTSVGNVIGTTAKWLRFQHRFGVEECQVLIGVLSSMSKKDIKNKRKDLEKSISKEWADRVMKELGIN